MSMMAVIAATVSSAGKLFGLFTYAETGKYFTE